MPVFSRCTRCGDVSEKVYREINLCPKCWQAEYYKRRKAARVASDKTEANYYITSAFKIFDMMKKIGWLDPIDHAYMTKKFLDIQEEVRLDANLALLNDVDTRMAAAAVEAEKDNQTLPDWFVDAEVKATTVEAEDIGKARQLIEEKEAAQKRLKDRTG